MISFLSLSLALVATTLAQDPFSSGKDTNGNAVPFYSPVRAPALPLAVRSPYTNTWVSTVNNGTLNSNGAMFWQGNPLAWEGIISVDNTSYEYFGTGISGLPLSLNNLKKAVPHSVAYDSQWSNFSLDAGPVRVYANFFSPVIPKNLCKTSVPLSYFEASFKSTDEKPHDVQLYSDINGRWVTQDNRRIRWQLFRDASPFTGGGTNSTDAPATFYNWLVNETHPIYFAERDDHALWGNLSYATTPGTAKKFTFEAAFSTELRYRYVQERVLKNEINKDFRGASDREPVFAFSHDFGSTSSGSVLYTVGTMHSPVIRYLNSKGVSKLEPWWTTCYPSMLNMIQSHYREYSATQVEAAQWEAQLKADVAAYYSVNADTIYSNSTPKAKPPYSNGTSEKYTNGTDQYGQQFIFDSDTAYGYLTPDGDRGVAIPYTDETESYYAIVALSARQIMGAYVLAVDPANKDRPLMFQKEISSNGNMNTVDVIFPAMPFFLYANPDMLRMVLDPLTDSQENNFYPNDYSMHDLGSNFPNATGHVAGEDEYMPVEESGNMIIMAYAYYKFTGKKDYLEQHYGLLAKWASYLIEFAAVPGNQLSTDDFAGRLTNQTNLAIKGIVALSAMTEIAKLARPSDAARFQSITTDYFNRWTYYGIDSTKNHTLLSYQSRASWGLLYNIYPAHLLDLSVIPREIYKMQSDWYPKVSQIFGVPLDSRHHYTKSDWQLWAAAVAEPKTRRLFVDAIAFWLNNTSTDRPFSDLYETVGTGGFPCTPDCVNFMARPVAGGHFSLLALVKAGRHTVTPGAGNGNGTVLPAPGQNNTLSWSKGVPVPATTETPPAHTGQDFEPTETRRPITSAKF